MLILSGHRMARTGSSRISAAVPGRVLRPASRSRTQVVGQRHPRAAGPFGDLEGGEPVDVDGRRRLADRLDHLEVVVAVEVGVDAPLQTDLGGPEGLGLPHPVGDLAQLEQVGAPPEVEGERALGEGAEPALEGADVGVVDVPVVDEGDLTSPTVSARSWSATSATARTSGPRAREQGDDLVLADGVAAEHAGQHLAHRAPGRPGWSPSGVATVGGPRTAPSRRTRIRARGGRGGHLAARGTTGGRVRGPRRRRRRAPGSAWPGRASARGRGRTSG